jgi:hypothetical protein
MCGRGDSVNSFQSFRVYRDRNSFHMVILI